VFQVFEKELDILSRGHLLQDPGVVHSFSGLMFVTKTANVLWPLGVMPRLLPSILDGILAAPYPPPQFVGRGLDGEIRIMVRGCGDDFSLRPKMFALFRNAVSELLGFFQG